LTYVGAEKQCAYQKIAIIPKNMGVKHQAGKVFGPAMHVSKFGFVSIAFNLFVDLKPMKLFWFKQLEDGAQIILRTKMLIWFETKILK
jgi:hypothetical protein